MTGYRDYDRSPLMQLLRFVTKSFAIGDLFGVHVRMYWAAAVLMPLIFWRWVPHGTDLERAVHTAIAFVGLFVVIWSHEMGHIAAGWRYRIRTDAITLSPLGGVAHMNSPTTTPRSELVVTLAGPAVHLAWLVVVWPLYLLLPDRVLTIAGWTGCPIAFAVWFLQVTNLSLLLFNLLPFFPLDGGRCLRALLALRMHPNRATMWATAVGIGGGALLILLALGRSDLESGLGVVLGLSCISQCLNERRYARHALVYGHVAADPWAMDPDAWKRGAGPLAEPSARRAGWFTRWRQARAERRAAQVAAAEQELDREVDRILERVHEVGMAGLSERDKAVLKRAAARRRGAG
ncbi:MAG: hypothetical protein JNL08_11035 [Planctomycetes bacterium]|nr:hypothetical protein [Planctomycetota bacterium]